MEKIAIGAIMKNEAPYILEWVYYHKALGFDLIIADNGGEDDTSKILIALHNRKVITRIDFRFKKKSPQFSAYRAILRLARWNGVKIIGFLDCDEFFTREIPIQSISPKFGAEYVSSEFERLNATQLSYYWLLYGSKCDQCDSSLPVLERFTYHSPMEIKRTAWDFKSFVKVKEMFKIRNFLLLGPKILSPHYFHDANETWYLDDEPAKNFDVDNKKISYINGAVLHFQIKTWEEFQRKVDRGGANTDGSKYNHNFFLCNDYNDVKSEIEKFIIDQVKTGINDLKQIIGDYSKLNSSSTCFTTFKAKVLSLGLSDIQNHEFMIFFYKISKKIKKIIAHTRKISTNIQ